MSVAKTCDTPKNPSHLVPRKRWYWYSHRFKPPDESSDAISANARFTVKGFAVYEHITSPKHEGVTY